MYLLCFIHISLLFNCCKLSYLISILINLFTFQPIDFVSYMFNGLHITYSSFIFDDNSLILVICNTELRGTESVEVTPQFVAPIWELVCERNNSDHANMEGGNGEDGVGASELGGGRDKGEEEDGEERRGERKRDSKGEKGKKGKKGQGRNSTHTQSFPSASYAQSFQGF